MYAGNTIWVIPGGHISLYSTGREPEHTSRDELHLLNTNGQEATLHIIIYYTNREPSAPYTINIKAKTVRSIRFNDLVDPEPLMLDTDYAVLIRSDIPVIVQFTRVDTSQPELAGFTSMAFPVDS
jgi:hypothetical protein